MSATSESQWPIPEGLSTQGRQAAETIRDFLVVKNLAFHGGGGRFYTPAEWAARGESWGKDSLLVVTHDGGDHAPCFNPDYESPELITALRDALRNAGVWSEQCTSWYTAIYPLPS
ncbi:hypothetical protein [Mycobacteroides chelonae]|nr:hypothetical protein [Mycobacteroides chelonae]